MFGCGNERPGCGKVGGLGATGRRVADYPTAWDRDAAVRRGSRIPARGQTRGRGEGRARGKDLKFGDFEVRNFDAGDFRVAGGCRFNR